MSSSVLRLAASALCAAALAFPSLVSAQNSPQSTEAGRADATKKRIDEIAEVAKALTGPAANPECVWLGRRVVSLLWRDDLDTAFRHLDLYDRFGCPGGHIQATFRCILRQGDIDPKATDTVNNRVLSCWINPTLQPASAAQAPVAAPAQPGQGTSPSR